MNSAPLLQRPLSGYRGRAFLPPHPARAQCQPAEPRVLKPADAKLRRQRRSGTRPPKRNRAGCWKGADRRRHSRGRMPRGFPFPPTHSCARSYEACTAMQRAGSELSQPRVRETGAARERRAQGPRNSVSKPGARWWVPPQYRARPRPRLRNLALRFRDAGDAKQPKKPRGYSRQQPTCSAEGTLPSIAATADARRSSSRQSRAIAGWRPPGRARAKAAARGGRRVPGRRCAPRGWLLRILSRSSWDRTPASAAWVWAGVCARGAVRARVDVGVHVCVCVYGRGGCVRACVRERAREC